MSENEHVCDSCNKKRAQAVNIGYSSLDEKTRETVDHFLSEYVSFLGPLWEDIEEAIKELRDELGGEGRHEVAISFSGKTFQGEEISLKRKISVSFQ